MERKYWFVFCKGDLLLEKTSDGRYTIPYQEEAPTPLKEWTNVHTITPFGDDDVRTYTIDGPVTDNPRYEMCGLRATYNKLPHELYQIAGKCQEILYWDANTRFCGVCGGPMKMHTEISKRCTHCGKEIWPLLATAIIVLIRREYKVLLVHARNFRGKFFGLVAGFVETGETLEEAVVREVHEEVGIKIKNIRYFASQPWPYPCGLMVGFTADYVSGDLHLQRSELDDAGWFDRDHLPPVPDKMSIARQLIDSWLEESSK
ncbi:MAG: NAD(+) diphosphatase [Prevotella sp.]|nr:NAD(+) diphosphatase [Prevotella sp.]